MIDVDDGDWLRALIREEVWTTVLPAIDAELARRDAQLRADLPALIAQTTRMSARSLETRADNERQLAGIAASHKLLYLVGHKLHGQPS